MKPAGRKSITFRLTLLFASVSVTVLLLLGLLIGSLVERHFEELDMELLVGKMELLQHVLKRIHTDRELEALPGQLEDAFVGHHGLAVVVSMRGQILYSTGGAKFPEELLAEAGRQPLRPMLWNGPDNHRYRGISAEVSTGIEGAAPVVVAVSTDLLHHEHFMHSFRTALWTVMGLAALITGFLGWVAARRGLAPLRDISRRAASITANRLDQRLSADSIPVELAEVAETLNEMLARLEESFHRLSDFSSDLAHELRTPISNLLTQTQVTLSRTRTLAEYQDVLASNAEEFERLARMIADMLFLAKADNGLIIPSSETVDLPTEVRELFSFYEAFAEEQGVSLALVGEGTVRGDRLMLRRALSNLLSNAIRHTPRHAAVKVIIKPEAGSGKIRLTFENPGESIPPEHLPRLFDRFYRVDSSRQKTSDGAGLGLAITKSIVEAHQGTIQVFSANGVIRFEIIFPIMYQTKKPPV